MVERNIISLTNEGEGFYCGDTDSPTIQDNLAWQNTGGDGSGLCAEWTQSNGNLVADPQFCNPAAGDYGVAETSPALTHSAGPLGAYSLAGCTSVPVVPTTWGRIKARYE